MGEAGALVYRRLRRLTDRRREVRWGLSGWPRLPHPLVFKDSFSLRRLANHNWEDEGSAGRAVGHIAGRYGARACYGGFVCSSLGSVLVLDLFCCRLELGRF